MSDHPASSNWSVGVDGGGSKTLAIVVDAQGYELGRGLSASANHQNVGADTAITHIAEAIALALDAARRQQAVLTSDRAILAATLPLHSAWFGLAGIDHPSDYELLSPRLSTFAHHIQLTNDAELILAALPNSTGIALIAGTGSIALGRNAQGASARAGGWGNLIGDEGSGYDLGRQCLQAVTQAADGRAQSTALTSLVLRHWHLHEPGEIIHKVYTNFDKSTIASLAPLVCSAAREGDEVASTIVERAAQALAITVLAVKKQLDQAVPNSSNSSNIQTTNLALGGGLLLHEPDFRAHVMAAISALLLLDNIVLVEEPALSAARAVLSITDTAERTDPTKENTWTTS